ncbi:YggS family pyridoxal phosphate-dependent enzyme [Vagococcus humatus]|uniref:Pyridoxal phosphate homeostasis protein n=1 Tax=Vagococcus humatus TaxID=1889241 RepID=A0A429Z6X6_9ENTE|nr:YggS family pyridoxal phosphate-dependent enzyme [Vagococcus humatus]RST89469.1 YggS family pyridoxal phosphate-dependent enzyme [Vagococcus humatus]
MLEKNLEVIQETVSKACASVNRSPKEVTLIGVTKSVTSNQARLLVQQGVTNLAENRVDSMLEKQAQLVDIPEITWHLIGTLQRRKVKDIVNQIDYFHALDNIKLAKEIQKRADHCIACFVQVNVSGEESKHGLNPPEVLEFVKELQSMDRIKVVGLMTMAPIDATEEELLQYFTQLKDLQQQVKDLELSSAPCLELSMGMSQDYPIAIKAGATCVRIGRAFFKE